MSLPWGKDHSIGGDSGPPETLVPGDLTPFPVLHMCACTDQHESETATHGFKQNEPKRHIILAQKSKEARGRCLSRHWTCETAPYRFRDSRSSYLFSTWTQVPSRGSLRTTGRTARRPTSSPERGLWPLSWALIPTIIPVDHRYLGRGRAPGYRKQAPWGCLAAAPQCGEPGSWLH